MKVTYSWELCCLLRQFSQHWHSDSTCLFLLLDYKLLQGRIHVLFAPGFWPKHLEQRKVLINIYSRKERIEEGKQVGKLQKTKIYSGLLTRLHQTTSDRWLWTCQLFNHIRKITCSVWSTGFNVVPQFKPMHILSLSLIWCVTLYI